MSTPLTVNFLIMIMRSRGQRFTCYGNSLRGVYNILIEKVNTSNTTTTLNIDIFI